MNTRLLLITSLCLILVAWASPNLNGLTATFEKQGMQREVQNADLFITSQVNQALSNDGHFGTEMKNVTISTKDGVVTMKGTVSDKQMKDSIVQKVKTVPGVNDVKDELEVQK